MLIYNLFFFILSGLALVISGTYLVKSLEKISRFLRISEFTAAFIIMAIATSIPELFVGLSSAIQGNPELSLGNVIGANILNLTLITGIFVLLSRGIKFHSKKGGKEVYFMLSSVILIILLYLIGNSLSRIDGIILLSLFIFNLYRMFKKRTAYKSKFNKEKVKRWEIILSVFIFIAALILLFLSSNYAVKYASLIATDLSLPKIIIGLFLISIATTLPELIFGVRAIMLGHKSMSIGDQTGTVFANITLVIGLVALIHPITAEFFSFLISVIFMFIAAFIFTAFMETKKKLEVIEGIGLILLYVGFVIIEFFVK